MACRFDKETGDGSCICNQEGGCLSPICRCETCEEKTCEGCDDKD